MRKLIAMMAVGLGLASPLIASDPSPLRVLMTGDDGRGWEAVGRINIGDNGMCTGALIADNLVLTAGHCMYDKTTGAAVFPQEIQFLAGWRNGRATAYRGVRRVVLHPQYSFQEPDKTARVSNDLALLELDHPIRNTSVQPFGIEANVRKGREVGVVSYAQSRAQSPALQELCQVLARQSGALVLSCLVDFGSSGSPVFVVKDGKPFIVSVISAKAHVRDIPVALGTRLEHALDELLQAAKEGQDMIVQAHVAPQMIDRSSPSEGTVVTQGAKFLRP